MMDLLRAAVEESGADYTPALFGLGGVLVGALIGLLGIVIQTRHADILDRRAELRRQYVEFESRTTELGGVTVRLDVVRAAGDPDPTADHLEDLQDEAANMLSCFESVGLLRLLAPRDTAGYASLACNAILDRDRTAQSITHKAFRLAARRDTAHSRKERRRAAKELSSHLKTHPVQLDEEED